MAPAQHAIVTFLVLHGVWVGGEFRIEKNYEKGYYEYEEAAALGWIATRDATVRGCARKRSEAGVFVGFAAVA